MKNIIKMSLVAAVAVTGLTTVGSANTLEEAFAASTVKGELKSQYFQKESALGDKSSILTNGGNISLKTGAYNGLTAGVTFQTAHIASQSDDIMELTSSTDTKTVDRSNYSTDMDASGTVMSESYLAYTRANTTAKIGRQYITTPLVAGSGSRIFKQSFEGVVVANTDIANTTLVAARVSKYQNRTDGSGGVPTFDDVYNGAYTVYAKNTSIPNLTIEAQYAVISEGGHEDAIGTTAAAANSEDVTVAYANVDYKLNPVTISAQTFKSDTGATVEDADGSLYGMKVAGKVNGVSVMAAYTTTSTGATVVSGLGSGADKSFTASPIAGGGSSYKADTDSYKIGLGTKVMGLGLNASYSNWETNGSEADSETNFTGSYAFNKAFSAKVMYSKYSGTTTDYRSRVYLSYKF